MRKRCSSCGRYYKGTVNSKTCPRHECKQELYRAWKRKKYGIPSISIPRVCIHCKKPFIIKDRRANRRKFCYKPDCIEANRKWAYRQARLLARAWRLRPKAKATGRLCAICDKPLNGDRHFRHDACVDSMTDRCDGDYKFCSVEDILDMEI